MPVCCVCCQMNAVNRLIFETWKKSKPRTSQFHVIREGTINMAMTSAEERDQRDEIKLKILLKKIDTDGTRVVNTNMFYFGFILHTHS